MATVAGKDADLTVANYDANCHEWSLEISADALENTNWDWAAADEGWRGYISGLRGFTGTITLYADDTPGTAILPGTTVTDAKFYVKESTTRGYKGDIITTGATPGATIDGVETLEISFQGTGALAVGNIG